jgi:hypothetical protein
MLPQRDGKSIRYKQKMGRKNPSSQLVARLALEFQRRLLPWAWQTGLTQKRGCFIRFQAGVKTHDLAPRHQ